MKCVLPDNDRVELSAGNFSAWIRDIRNALRSNTGMRVPCGTCHACCSSSYFIHINPDEKKTLDRIPDRFLFPAPLRPGGHMVMGYDRQGRCPMFKGDQCSIYQYRPITCRIFDCRVLAASGLAWESSEDNNIFQQARRWQFNCPTERDRQLLAAVQAAAKFLRGHPECIPGEVVHRDDLQCAIVAVKVCDVFFKAAKSDSPRKLSDSETAQELSKSYKRFEQRSHNV